MPRSWYRKLFPAVLAIAAALVVLAPAGASAADPPDPLDYGPYTAERLDPFLGGLATLQEPNSNGAAPSGSTSSITLQIRGSAYFPSDKPGKAPVIVLVHGNHSSCDSGSAPACTIFKRNDEGYNYLAKNLATWGYAVFSVDQDQLMSRQDGSFGKGMHSRRLLISALLDSLYAANEAAGAPTGDYNLPASLVGKLDFTRIGLMGHSRGGDAVSSFIDYNRTRPEGRRYPLRGVISLAPVDYERRAPYGVPYMTILPTCDGDVSNLQGARMFERGQYRVKSVYPMIQSAQVGGNHNWYNTVWKADGDDSTSTDDACKIGEPNGLRMNGEAAPESYKIDNSDKLNPSVNTRISADPTLMGDQQKVGLATMSAFFRRYVGGEGAFEPYLTGELAEEGKPQVPQSACPTSESGTRISCLDRVSTNYFAPAAERLDVIQPSMEMPLAMSALGTKLNASGFSNPYLKGGGVTPFPEKTASGLAWCNPEPKQTLPNQLGEGGYPDAAKPCPLPAGSAVGGQKGVRENGPVNQSYGRQLAVAWNGPARLSTKIPATAADVSEFKALALSAAVNFFDSRNPARSTWDPQVGMQDFTIAVTDGDGNVAKVSAGDARYGSALQQSHGSISSRVHVILKEIRVPLSELAAQGVDLTDVRKLELLFGGEGNPATGSIQLADVRFQEAAAGTDVLMDSTTPNAGPGEGPPSEGPNPVAEMEAFDASPGKLKLPDVSLESGSNTWTVDDNGLDCPSAQFSSIQTAVDYASPWDTIVVCPGLYEEGSTPVNSVASPVAADARNGLTIDKPLKIQGAGAGLVTITPKSSTTSILGSTAFLRDGGGNIVTITRSSMGSSEYNENFTEISGVTIEASATNSYYVDAGVAFFNTSGRVVDSVVGPLRLSSSAATQPHGWGIIATNSLIGEGSGTIERHVTVENTKVSGYRAGGILFDDASGGDASAAANEPSKIKLKGYVINSVVTGMGATTAYKQTGIRYHGGAGGYVKGSKITGNLYTTTPRESVGILLTGANTADLEVSGSVIGGNGYGLFNADVTNTAVREGAPVDAAENYWGTGGAPVAGPSDIALGKEGISGVDGGAQPSVAFEPVLGSEPLISAPGTTDDAAPVGEIVEPGDGESVKAGTAVEPVVYADDDFGIKSVSLTADGVPVATLTESPYAFSWTPTTDDGGETVTLEATIVDSSGQTVTSSVDVEVAEEEVKPEPPVVDPPKPPVNPDSNFLFGKLLKNTSKGTAVISITVPGPGTLVLDGTGKVKGLTRSVSAAGVQQIAIKPKSGLAKTLKNKGSVKVTLKFTFTPTGGSAATKTKAVVLKKK